MVSSKSSALLSSDMGSLPIPSSSEDYAYSRVCCDGCSNKLFQFLTVTKDRAAILFLQCHGCLLMSALCPSCGSMTYGEE